MGKLILLNRPGIQIICGKITEVRESKNVFVIEGTVGHTKKHLLVHAKNMASMNFKTGDAVVASIKSTEATVALSDGAKLSDDMFEVWAYYVRFSGAFDFPALNDCKEQHVFCGKVEDKRVLSNGAVRFNVVWNKDGKEEKRSLYSPRDLKFGKRVVFLTGPGRAEKEQTTYVVMGVQNLN